MLQSIGLLHRILPCSTAREGGVVGARHRLNLTRLIDFGRSEAKIWGPALDAWLARFVLGLAFAGFALGCTLGKTADFFAVAWIAHLDRLMILPALLLGARSWWRTHSSAHWWSVLLCLTVCVLGLWNAPENGNWRAIALIVSVAAVLPLAALVVEHGLWWYCARVFVCASGAALAIVFWYDLRNYLLSGRIVAGTEMARLGFLYAEDFVTRLGNPNRIGAQMALAAVLAFMLFLHDRIGHQPQRTRFPIAWTLLFVLGCLATASRGAFATLGFGLGLMLYWALVRTRWISPKQVITFGAVAVGVMVVASVFWENSPFRKLASRLAAGQDVVTLSNRTPIWRHAMMAWASEPMYLLLGTGTGRADEVLARHEVIWGPARMVGSDDQGDMHRNSHSIFVEWLLSFGFVGLLPALWLLTQLALRARELDRRDGTLHRQTLLVMVGLLGATAVIFRWEWWPALASLSLAMMSDPLPARQPRQTDEAQPFRGTIPLRTRLVRRQSEATAGQVALSRRCA